MKTLFLSVFLTVVSNLNLIPQSRWNLESDRSISWSVKNGEVHTDNIEMSGKYILVITNYGVDEKGKLVGSKQLFFPMLRTIPNDTHGNFICTFASSLIYNKVCHFNLRFLIPPALRDPFGMTVIFLGGGGRRGRAPPVLAYHHHYDPIKPCHSER